MINNISNTQKIITIIKELKQNKNSIDLNILYNQCKKENIEIQEVEKALRTLYNMGVILKSEDHKICFRDSSIFSY